MKSKLNYLALILITIMVLSSCSSVNLLTMSVVEPAPVYLPLSAKKIGIFNRSQPDEENKLMENLDKILTAEGKNLDKDAAEELVKAMHEELRGYDRFERVKMLSNNEIKCKFPGVFPTPMTWSQVEKICKDNDVDALFVLSYYDTDAKIDYKAVNIEIDGPLGVKVPAIEHHATVVTFIKVGWRIYYPAEKVIVDEFAMSDRVVVTGKGINPAKAAAAILGRKDAVNKVSYAMGRDYPGRILPYKIRVSRYYYVRGSDNFKIGMRRARAGNWDGAAELWEKELNNSKRKVAGRAHYNMAIINEINGNLEEAVGWAEKSYTDYNDKRALRYLNILRYRIDQRERLKAQEQE